MRLLHLIHTPRHSGAEILVCELCRLHRDWGHACAVASFAPPEREFRAALDGLERAGTALFLPDRPRRKLGRILQFRAAVGRFRPDVVFGHSALPSLYGRFAVGSGAGRAGFVSVLHSAANDYAAPLFWAAERLTRSRLDHVVAVSAPLADAYRGCFGSAVPVGVVVNGVDIARFARADRGAARRAFGLGDATRLVLQVGRLCALKNQRLSLEALRPLLAAEKTELWFAGLTEEPGTEADLRRMAAEGGLGRAVRFLGSRADIPELLAAADLFLMPSRHEAQGIALLEALASGVPTLASEIPIFGFARAMPSVRLCAENAAAWTEAARDMLTAPRAVRDLDAFSIESTARAYLEVAEAAAP